MQTAESPKKRVINASFPRRIVVYENDEGVELMESLAKRRGLSSTALLRALVREEAKREGVAAGARG
jgi:hypothetical protein